MKMQGESANFPGKEASKALVFQTTIFQQVIAENPEVEFREVELLNVKGLVGTENVARTGFQSTHMLVTMRAHISAAFQYIYT